ncbi:MAG: NAD(P)H-dependent glycerol-3-phosphate dehydrogenase [Phyllobacterium sp.]
MTNINAAKIAVLGGGAYGTALATMTARNGHDVCIYARDADTVSSINQKHENPRYLPGIALPHSLKATNDPATALDGAAIILATIPAQAMTGALLDLAPLIPAEIPLVICAKGIERSSGLMMSEVVRAVLPDQRIAALSGPSFATDVANGLPTAVSVACEDQPVAEWLARSLSGPSFRCYSTTDLIGVEVGGALKNVLAIAAGAATGGGFGASAQAALVTRGFVELRRIGQAMGAAPETIMGLSGLGDLMLTCSSPQSRNYSYGLAIGRGEPLENRPLAEGVATSFIAAELCAKRDISAPIISAVAHILAGQLTVGEAVDALLSRRLKGETD